MRSRRVVLALAFAFSFLFLSPTSVFAEDVSGAPGAAAEETKPQNTAAGGEGQTAPDTGHPSVMELVPAPVQETKKTPNLLSIGGGWFDADKNFPRKEAADFRLEHRWGVSLLSWANPSLSGWDSFFQLHPIAGVEATHHRQFYGFAGFAFDFLLGRYLVLTPSTAVGLYYRGDGKRLGSVVEFRSMLEGGFRFDNDMRLTAFCSHISNAGITDVNPGANTLGGYLHIPTNLIFGN